MTSVTWYQRGAAPLPVFLISFNRGRYLERVIESYRRQDIRVEIVIHDNGSSDPDTLDVLSRLSASGIKVWRNEPIFSCDELNNVNLSVQRYFDTTGSECPYAVSDCDVDLSTARADALSVYLELLETTGVECVGPMLKIDDIPRSYPLFTSVMERHIGQFYGREPEWAETSVGTVAILTARIDTTLAVHRAGSAFRRLKNGLRVYHPFEARHLDWYGSSTNLTVYHETSSCDISHWDNARAFSEHRSMPQLEMTYKVVEGSIGGLRVVCKSTQDSPD